MKAQASRSTAYCRVAYRRRGLTLAELVVSMGIMSLVMGGLASALMIASRALPDRNSPATIALTAADVAEQIMSELQYATTCSDTSKNSVAFTVPDRDDDGVDESIQYTWDGTAGNPVVRYYNGTPFPGFLSDVHDFSMSYTWNAVTRSIAQPALESANLELVGYTHTDNLSDRTVEDGKWWAQHFKPTLPADAISWKVTYVRFLAKRAENKSATTLIQLRLPDEQPEPTDTIIDETEMSQLSLTDAFQWVEVSFSGAATLSPEMGLFLTFVTNQTKSAKLRYRNDHVMLTDGGWIEGSPVEWKDLRTDEALLFHIHGTYTTPQSPVETVFRYLTGVDMTLQVGASDNDRSYSGVQVLNTPEATGP